MLRIKTFTFNPFQENTYVLSNGQEAIIIDPGCYEDHEQQELDDYIAAEHLKPVLLINTHGHIDHVLGNDHVKTRYQIPLAIHAADVPVLKAVKAYASNYGFPAYAEAEPDRILTEGETIRLGDTSCSVMFLPGHAPGHIGLYFKAEGKLISGDVLFRESIGRTDLPGGDHGTLIQSITQQVFRLPDEVEVFPGHGPTTTVGHEKIHNPWCGAAANMG
ncbi:MAG: MBL fold metallo-hydrolase [Bacteroidota bacterium]